MKRSLLLALLWFGCGTFAGAEPAPAESIALGEQATLVSAHFGAIKIADGALVEFREATIMPHRIGFAYGWMLLVEGDAKGVRLEEELVLPGPALNWGAGEDRGTTAVSDNRASATQTVSLNPGSQGWTLTTVWSVVEGDPLGTYRSRLKLNGRTIAERKFVLAALPPGTGPIGMPPGTNTLILTGGKPPPEGGPDQEPSGSELP